MMGYILFENKTRGIKGDSISGRKSVGTAGRMLLFVCALFAGLTGYAQGTWVPVAATAPHYNEGVMLLLTDGSVLCKTSSGGTGDGTVWDRLTPDSHGSYIHGTWSTIAPMHDERLYFSSQVLTDGRVYVAGGEYGSGGPKSEVWDPVTNVWTQCPQIVTAHNISDANSEMLPDGTILQAVVDTGGTKLNFIYDPVTNTYSHTASCLRGNNEAVWVKLPDNSVIFVDNYGTTSERYIPATHTWVNDATVPVSLYDPYGSESGAGFVLPNGKVFFIGSPGTSAYYTPSGTASAGSWAAGPGLPNGWGAPDAASAMMPNGKILMALSPPPTSPDHFPDSTAFYQFDYTTNTFVLLNAPGVAGDTITGPSYITNMLSLPDGTILYTRQGHDQYFEYVPDSGPLAAGKPTISNIIPNTCSQYTITGALFNGISEGAAYGDDWQMSTNYPIVRLTSGTEVYYANTLHWNRPGAVMTGAALDTATFTLPAGIPAGNYSVQVIANGNPSDNFSFTTIPSAIAPVTAAICTGSSTSLSDTATGGTWISSNMAVGTVSAGGVVYGMASGTTVVSYTVAGGCAATATVNVLVTPATISGITYAGIGGTSLLTDVIPLGTWSSNNTGIATVNGSTGVVTGVAAGTTTITYTNICGYTTATYTVVPGTLCVPAGSNPSASCNTYGIAFKSVTIDGDAGTMIADSAHCDGTGYIDRTALGCTLHDGSSYNVAITTGLNAVYTQFWIDFNQDGVFQSSETVGGNTTSFPYYGNTTITIPGTAASGTYKMRGVLSFSGSGHHYPTIDPCMTSYSYGEARDYTVVIVPAPALEFTGSAAKTVCENTTADDITANLTINDAATSGSETWSVVSGPAHGTLGGFPAAGTATGGSVTPTGCTYTPTAGYSGIDAFTIMCTDAGGSTTMQTVGMSVLALANPGTLGGTMSVCVGATTALSTSGSGGGTWSSTSPATGTVSASGVVTGIAGGTTTISYGVTNSCGTIFASTILTVNPLPNAGSITGASSVCAGGNTLLSDLTSGGIWSSTNIAAGTVSASGLVAGIAAGTTTISYTMTNSCGTTAATKVVTVNPLPSAGSISGVTVVCPGGTTSLTDATVGGAWSSTNTGVGTVSASGVVYGVTNGTTTISYTLSGSCGTVAATAVVSVNSTTSAGSISGGSTVCIGATIHLTDGTGGGVWSSTNPSAGTVSTSGVVTGIGSGTTTISYTISNSCGTAAATMDVTVNAGAASAGTITGTGTVCPGATLTLTDLAGGGVWSSTSTGIATVASTGVVTGVAAGTSTISYTVSNTCGSVAATTIVTVNPATSAGSIIGPATVAVGSNIALTDIVTGGVWSASNGNATVSGGLVSGISNGTVTISYAVTGACGTATATRLVTVGSSTVTVTVAAITGYYFYLCAGATAPFFDATAGGTWSINAADAGIASVSATGVVSGISAGTARLSYTVGTSYATTVVTVYPLPAAISGNGTVCIGSTALLSDATTGGVWSSSIPATATISAVGLVTGVTVGTVPIYYTLTAPAGCRSVLVVTVGPNPAAITGPTMVCAGSTISLTDATAGGSWSSASSNITVDGSGNVTGGTAGSATVTYSVGSGCVRTYNITVSSGPVAGTISGASSVTTGLNITLTDAVTGGVWSASNSNATVSGAGLVTGVIAGTVTISYTVTNSCGSTSATYMVTVNASGVSGITGTLSVCIGATTALSDATTGGTWHSANTSVATVGTSGVVTGIGAGTATISYTIAGVPGTAVVTVNPLPSGIGGATSVCNGSTITMSDFTAGGTWTSTAGVSVTSGTTVTTVTGLADGANTVNYSLATGCYKTYAVTVKSLPTSILGNLAVCGVGSVTFLSDLTTGVSWTISPVGTATISPSGRVYGVSAGTATVTYTASDLCIATATVTVNPLLVVAAISGANNVGHGLTITLSDATTGGVWSSSNPALGSVDGSGAVTGVGTSGTVTITYAVPYPSSTGCTAAAIKSITVHTPAPHDHGAATTNIGGAVSIADANAGGEWTSSDNTVATVDGNGIVTGMAAGEVNITHVVMNSEGAITNTVTHVSVTPLPFEVRLVPNPNKGSFTISGVAGTDKDEVVVLEITNMLGQVVYTGNATAIGGVINEQVLLNSNLSNGMYLLNVKVAAGVKVFHFVLEK